MGTYFTDLVNGQQANAATFNAPLNELDAAIADLLDGTLDFTAIDINGGTIDGISRLTLVATTSTPVSLTSEVVGVGLTGELYVYENTAAAAVPGWRTSRARGSSGTPGAVAINDQLGRFISRGHDGSAWGTAANMVILATELWTGSAHGSKVLWQLTPTGSATLASVMTLDGAGLDVVNVVRAGGVIVDADPGSGVAATITHTNNVAGAPTDTVTPTKWEKVYDGTTVRYRPLYT